MEVTYRIEMTRKTYDGICSYLQGWGDFYASSEITVVLRGSIRSNRHAGGGATGLVVGSRMGLGDPKAISKRFNTARIGLGRAHVGKNTVTVDLRELTDPELDALQFAASSAKLKPQQTRALVRIENTAREFKQLPPLVRIALAGVD